MVERNRTLAPQPEKRWNYEFRDSSASIEEMFKHQIPIVPVNRRCFWGIQTLDEYEGKKRKKLEKDFAKLTLPEIEGILNIHPVHAVALPMNLNDLELWDRLDPTERYALTVLDGHHRIRYAPKGIKEIPSMIFTIDQAFEVYRRRYRGTKLDFVRQVVTERDEALRSFTAVSDRFLPGYVYIHGSGDIRTLAY